MSRVDSGAKSMLVGVIRFHGKDLCDINTCTVLSHFMAEDSEVVSDASASVAKSAVVESVCVECVQCVVLCITCIPDMQRSAHTDPGTLINFMLESHITKAVGETDTLNVDSPCNVTDSVSE